MSNSVKKLTNKKLTTLGLPSGAKQISRLFVAENATNYPLLRERELRVR